MLLFQGPAVWQDEDNVRINGWLEEDGSARVVIEVGGNAEDDVTITVPATSVGLDLRVALGLTPKMSVRSTPSPGTYARGAKARRAKRSWES